MRSRAALAPALLLACAAAACGGGGDARPRPAGTPALGVGGDEPTARDLGFPAFATKNTTRVPGADPVASAAAVARAVFPSTDAASRPRAVVLVDAGDWRAGVAAAVLVSAPVRAAVLLSDGRRLPQASAAALRALRPTGARVAGRVQVVRVGDVARPRGLRTATVTGGDAFALARALDAFQAQARGRPSRRVLVASAEDPAFAMPAAAWAAKAGDPVLFVRRDAIPAQTRAALDAHRRPQIHVLGPPSVVSDDVLAGLRRLGRVRRIAGPDPVTNAIAFARFDADGFGWGIREPGHGLVFASVRRPLDAAAAAPLSASGSYGPLLLVDEPKALPSPLADYLLDIQPGYDRDPVRGVYNHGWIVGDGQAVSVPTQSRIDALLEISPVNAGTPPQPP